MKPRTLYALVGVGLLVFGTVSVSAAPKDPTIVYQIGKDDDQRIIYVMSDGSLWEENHKCRGLQLKDFVNIKTKKKCEKDNLLGS